MLRALSAASFVAALATVSSVDALSDGRDARQALIRRSQVWMPTEVASKDLWRGPDDGNGFAPGATIECDHVDKRLSGRSPKIACRIGKDDELKVKYGGDNGEVYAEVAATRLLWALGFPADRMYPVKVICRGCPDSIAGVQKADGRLVLDPASVERKYPAHEIHEGAEGWSWSELDAVSEADGGASRAHRDALKLLAVFLQHTDSKPQQQRLACAGGKGHGKPCEHPIMMLNDVGLTFGRTSRSNADAVSSVNLVEWSRAPVWKNVPGCVGNLPKSLTGTLTDPPISEQGRRFLADLLLQLSDRQLDDLFRVARFHLRPRSPERGDLGFPTTSEWVEAFKQKRAEIVDRRCT